MFPRQWSFTSLKLDGIKIESIAINNDCFCDDCRLSGQNNLYIAIACLAKVIT